ncbi:MAG: peptide ABC transporter substrate-binding protein, partial [Gemmatimonadota bacterium]|nr:peptide ABC transporter substrate-binding protein [Gemmatimonadota bacterium]
VLLLAAAILPATGFSHAQHTNSVGVTLPADAAPPEQQVFRLMSPEPRSLDIQINLYDGEGTLLPFETLLIRDELWQPIPAAATGYDVSEDAREWTFHLRQGARWSDGRPVTAHDFVYAFRRMLDPANANPYAFFYYDIKNAKAISLGEIEDPDQLGVRAVDDLTFQVLLERGAPHFPHVVSFGLAYPTPRWTVEKHGRKWTEVDKIVSNSGFRMSEWATGSHMTFVPDPMYNGPHKPMLEKVIHPFRYAAAQTVLAYENNEVDVENVDINDLDRIERHPLLSGELVRSPGRTTWYLFFKVGEPPFNDVRVREAFARALDRDAICRIVLRGTAAPAYSMMPPDFREYNGEAMKPYQAFDPERAKALMREAGYPNGRGFPRQEMWIRAPTPSMQMAGVAIQSMLLEHLGVNVSIRTLDRTAYMSKLYNWEMDFGFLRFVADYMDPRNMLDMTWHSQPKGAGRHDWANSEFDALVETAGAELDPETRTGLYRQAEEILVGDYGAAFVFHPLTMQLRKSNLKGYTRYPDGTVGGLMFSRLYKSRE